MFFHCNVTSQVGCEIQSGEGLGLGVKDRPLDEGVVEGHPPFEIFQHEGK